MARGVGQLAHVARPRVAHVGADRRGRQPRRIAGRGQRPHRQLARDEVREQAADVIGALAQRRHPDASAGEPVIELRPQRAGVGQVGVARGDHAHVDATGAIAADRAGLAGLERAQQHRLDLGRCVRDLVEEQRAAVGFGEQPRVGALGAGERTARVAEQLRGGHRGRERRHVDRDERRARAAALVMERARDVLLATAGLAGDQHRDVERRDPGDVVAQRIERRTRADQVAGRDGARRAAQVEQQRDPPGELEHRAARQRRRGQLERPGRYAVDDELGDLGRRDPHAAARQRRERDRPAAQVRITERRAHRRPGRGELGLEPRQPRRQQRDVSDPLAHGMPQHREPRGNGLGQRRRSARRSNRGVIARPIAGHVADHDDIVGRLCANGSAGRGRP